MLSMIRVRSLASSIFKLLTISISISSSLEPAAISSSSFFASTPVSKDSIWANWSSTRFVYGVRASSLSRKSTQRLDKRSEFSATFFSSDSTSFRSTYLSSLSEITCPRTVRSSANDRTKSSMCSKCRLVACMTASLADFATVANCSAVLFRTRTTLSYSSTAAVAASRIEVSGSDS